MGAGAHRPPAGARRGGLGDALARLGEVLQAGQGPGLVGDDPAGLLGDVAQVVGVHEQDPVGHVQVVPGAAHDHDRGDAPPAEQRGDAVHQGRDGLALGGHELAHARVADEQVRGGGVLVQQQRRGAGLDGLDDGGGLGGGSRGVAGGEGGGVAPGRQVGDEGGQVDAGHGAPVGGPHLDGVGDRGDELAPVPGHVRVDAALDGAQQRGLAVVAASDDDVDARLDDGAAHRPGVRELHRGGHGLGGLEGNAAVQGIVAHPGAARQDGAVGEEGHPAVAGHCRGQGPVVLKGGDVAHEPVAPLAGEVHGLLQLAHEVAPHDPGGLVALDGAALGGQGQAGADLQHPTGPLLLLLGAQDDAGALQDLLARGGDGQRRAAEARVQLAGEEVAHGQAAVCVGQQVGLVEQF